MKKKFCLYLSAFLITFMCIGMFRMEAMAAEANASNAVASVSVTNNEQTTTTYYTTLQSAVDAAEGLNGSTLKVLEAAELKSELEIEGGNFQFDLNGYELKCLSGTFGAVEVLGGEVTFLDSSSKKSGCIIGKNAAVNINGGKAIF